MYIRFLCGSWLACDGGGAVYISIPWVTATYGSALTAAHFLRDQKVSKKSSPHHSAPRSGSVCPNAGLNPWAAAMGHPWPSAANPASCRVTHGFKPALGQRGLTGRLRSKSKARSTARSKARSKANLPFCGSWLACDGGLPANPYSSDAPHLKCGSGLARECGGSVSSFVTDTPHSRASPLPHWTVFASNFRPADKGAFPCIN